MKLVKIFGERNTSTNALKKLLEENSNSRVAPSVIGEVAPRIRDLVKIATKTKLPHTLRERLIDYGFSGKTALNSWKHTATNFENIDDLDDAHVIFCVRHPASWVLGLYRKPYQIHETNYSDLRSFLDIRWTTAGRERLQKAPISATETYNMKLESYAQLQESLSNKSISYSIVRHEDFAVNQLEVFSKLAMHLDEPAEHPKELTRSTKDSRKDADYYKNYYGKMLWLKDIDSQSLDKINNEIDWAQLSQYEYSPI